MRRTASLFLCVATVTLTALGCSSKSETKETVVTGSVLLDGEKLTMGEVYFESEDGKASARGEIAPDGTYRMPSSPLGKVKAAVRTANYARFARPASKDGKTVTVGGRDGTYIPVPKKYEDVATSGLSYTVAADSVIEITISKK